jgi:prepilin-type N-terminal cleavage/methylation domain-containing protein
MSQQYNHGFTIIELILVMSIITVIMGFSASYYSRFIQQNAVLNTTDQLMGDYRRAQLLAMSGKLNANWGVNLATASSTLTLYAGNSFATRNNTYDETFTLNSNIHITGAVDTNFTHLTGTPSATPTVVISGLGSSDTVTLNAQGVVSR